MIEEIQCSKCKNTLGDNDTFCNNCGYPEKGTIDEKNRFNYSVKLKENVLRDAHKKLKNVKVMLYVIAGLNFLIGIFFMLDEYTFVDGIVSLIASGVFLACIAWVNKQPLTGILAAFIFWILMQLSVILVDPSQIFSGIILKIIFIGIFIKGITSAKDVKVFSEKLKTVNNS